MKGWKSSQGIIKLPRLTAETFYVLTELICLCAFTDYSADKKGPFVGFIFYYPSQSQWSSKPRWLMLAQAELSGAAYPSLSPPRPQCRIPKDPSCWGWSPRTWPSRLDCPTIRCQSKNQLDLQLCKGQGNEQRAVVCFLQQSKLPEAKWENLGQLQPNLGLEEKFLIGLSVCCPAQNSQMWITMAYPTTDSGEYNLVARCRWKEVPRGAAWIASSSQDAWRGHVHVVGWLANTIITDPGLKTLLTYSC